MINNCMLKRKQNWNYRQRCIYMITVTVEKRRPLLGRLTGCIDNPATELSDVGMMVAQCWQEIPARFPGVSLLEWQVMPDHFHGIIFVQAPQDKPLGAIIGAFKAHSTSLYREGIRADCGAAQNESASPEAPPASPAPSAPSPSPPPAVPGLAVPWPAACGRLEGPAPSAPSPSTPPAVPGPAVPGPAVPGPAACGGLEGPAPSAPSPSPPPAVPGLAVPWPAACGGLEGPAPSAPSPSTPPAVPGPAVPWPAACGRLEARLWSPGYQDTILLHRGQLANMRAYIKDNPRRLAVKRAHPELFRIIRNLSICGHTFAAIGNPFLLDAPVKRQVQISRSVTPEALAAAEADLLAAALHGAVLVSPCISPGEKQIARAALQAELPLIVILENGFPELYKPPKSYFDACAAGRLLMLAPWPHHSDRRSLTREQCLTLNSFAEQITQEDNTP